MAVSDAFVRRSEQDWVVTGPGARRRVLTHTDALMVVEFDFEAGAIGALHSHPHVQASYIARGSFEVTVDGRMEVLRQGDSFIVASDLVHGVKALEPGTLIDSFTPVRADFL
ncbi:MAG: cupin domain-containing protein [Rhizobiaceae bacterium]|nr:cupin domain-containing protein [Rhizobiaceae bacterium]